MTTSVSGAWQILSVHLDRVQAGEEVTITQHGRVVPVLVRPDLLEGRGASAN